MSETSGSYQGVDMSDCNRKYLKEGGEKINRCRNFSLMKLTFPWTLYLKIEETEKWHQREQIVPFFFKVRTKQSPIPKIGFWGVLRICW